MGENDEARGVHRAFTALINGSEQVAVARGEISKRLLEQLSNVARDFGKEHAVSSKKCFDFAGKYNAELHATYVSFMWV